MEKYAITALMALSLGLGYALDKALLSCALEASSRSKARMAQRTKCLFDEKIGFSSSST